MRKLILPFLTFIMLVISTLAYNTYDITPPKINSFDIKPGPKGTLQITWNLGDDEGLAGFILYRNEEVIYKERISGTRYISIYQDSSYILNKTYTYKLIVYDAANNSAERSIVFMYDSTPPKITSSTNILSNQRRLDITTDEEAICSFGYDPKKDTILIEENFKINHSVPLSKIVEGKNLIYVKCVDSFNNEMSSFVIVDFNYDITDPTKISNGKYSIENGKIKLSWDAASDENGIGKYNIYDEDDRFLGSTTTLSWSENERGIKKYYVSAVDKAGNEGAKTRIDINETSSVEQPIEQPKQIKKKDNQTKINTDSQTLTNKTDVIAIAIISWIVLGIVVASFIIWKIYERKKDPHGLRSYMIRRRRLRNFRVKFKI